MKEAISAESVMTLGPSAYSARAWDPPVQPSLSVHESRAAGSNRQRIATTMQTIAETTIRAAFIAVRRRPSIRAYATTFLFGASTSGNALCSSATPTVSFVLVHDAPKLPVPAEPLKKQAVAAEPDAF
jgi:hypothetical protein